MRGGRVYTWEWRSPPPRRTTVLGLAVRFVVNVAALWAAQALVRGFSIDGAAALLFGAAIFGGVNAVIRPAVAAASCALTCATLGLFTLVINTAMLALTAWLAGKAGLAFRVDGVIAASLAAIVISAVSTVLSRWAEANVTGAG